jgi:hypothetical protein
MKAHEKREILAALDSGRKALLGALSGVTDDLAVRSPGLGKWSILQCVEHTAVSEDYLFSQLTAAKHSDMPLIDEQREALITRSPLLFRRLLRSECARMAGPEADQSRHASRRPTRCDLLDQQERADRWNF